jgi:hypothetical protein
MTIPLSSMPPSSGIRRLIVSLAIPFFAGALLLSSCGPAMTRPARERADLEKLRSAEDEQVGVETARSSAACLNAPRPNTTGAPLLGSRRR